MGSVTHYVACATDVNTLLNMVERHADDLFHLLEGALWVYRLEVVIDRHCMHAHTHKHR